nr:MAG TPA: hypothetical protein [Caudoviricetes sp.]
MADTARTATAPRSRYSLPTYESPRPPYWLLPLEVCCDPIWSRWPIGDPNGSGPGKERS